MPLGRDIYEVTKGSVTSCRQYVSAAREEKMGRDIYEVTKESVTSCRQYVSAAREEKMRKEAVGELRL